MDKKKSKYKDDYSLRTLAYYQREGGIYNDLISILQKIRSEVGMLLTPNRALNLASEAYDRCITRCRDEKTNAIVDCGWDELKYLFLVGNYPGPLTGLASRDEAIVKCVLGVLLAQHKEFCEKSVPQLSFDMKYAYPSLFQYFEELMKSMPMRENNQLESLIEQLAEKETIIEEKDLQIAELSDRNSELEKKIATIEPVYDAYVENIVEGSDYDQYLTLDTILRWAKKRKHYKLADQVITMLKDLGRKTATDEELEKIESVESELLTKYSELSIVNNNMGIGSNILTGITSNPMMPMGYDQNQIMQKFIEFLNNGARRENKD